MAKSNSPKSSEFYTPTHKADGTKLSRAERKAANKAKFAAEQAAKRAAKPKTKRKAKTKQPAKVTATATKPKAVKVEAVLGWMADNPKRKQFTSVDISDWMTTKANTKTGKRLANKNLIDTQMSKANQKTETHAQMVGGLRA